jgi:membrane protease YdiL (CAAX protease family)
MNPDNTMTVGGNTGAPEIRSATQYRDRSRLQKLGRSLYTKAYTQPLAFFGTLSFISLIWITQLSLYWRPAIGVYVNAAAFVILLAVALMSEKLRQLATSTAILPVTYMAMLCLGHFSPLSTALIYYEILLALTLIYRHVFKLDESLDARRFSWRSLPLIPTMILCGEALGVVGYALLRKHYAFYGEPLTLTLSSAVLFAIVEESYFRGLLQNLSTKATRPLWGVVTSVFMYAALNVSHQSLITIVFAAIAGLVLSLAYMLKQSLFLTSIMNATMKVIFIGTLYVFTTYAR